MTEDELRQRTRRASLIIFGGVGFAGRNKKFNANYGIYNGVISREQEIQESKKFEKLHDKAGRSLYDKNVIVFTHMPKSDWSSEDTTITNFVYVSGHNHRNYYFDDGKKRVYADNQVGYGQKDFCMKQFSINRNYDWFSDYKDGIYEITKEDYQNFYRGINETITFNRKFNHLYMIKKEGVYMFLISTTKNNLLILNGGAVKDAGNSKLEYFYKKLNVYAQSVKKYLRKNKGENYG